MDQPPDQPQYPYQPSQTPPPPPYQPGNFGPPQRPKRNPWQWYRVQSRITQVIIAIGAVIAIIFVVTSAVSGGTQGSPQAVSPTPTTQSQPTQASQPTATPTSQPTPTPTKAPTKGPTITHGTPHLGGPFSDFVGKYGQPASNGTNQQFFADTAQTIFLFVEIDGQNDVTRITVTGPDKWKDSDTESFCSQYLPGDASQFNRTPPPDPILIDFHSGKGEIAMQLAAPTCLMFYSQS